KLPGLELAKLHRAVDRAARLHGPFVEVDLHVTRREVVAVGPDDADRPVDRYLFALQIVAPLECSDAERAARQVEPGVNPLNIDHRDIARLLHGPVGDDFELLSLIVLADITCL